MRYNIKKKNLRELWKRVHVIHRTKQLRQGLRIIHDSHRCKTVQVIISAISSQKNNDLIYITKACGMSECNISL